MMKNTQSFANQSQLNPRFSAPRRKQKKVAPTTAQNTTPFNNHKQRVTTPHLAAPSYAKSRTTPTVQQTRSPSRTGVPMVCPYSPSPKELKKGRLLKRRKTALPSKRGKHQKYNKTPPATTEYRSAWKPYKYQ